MPGPTLTSITPSSGLTVGDVFVEIVGTGFFLKAQGSVQVTFGGVPAIRAGVVSTTRIIAAAPPGNPEAGSAPNLGKVDVVVTNVDTNGHAQGSATLVKGFQYKRPTIDYPSDFSNHPAIALVTRTLVEEFQRTVIKNVESDVHPEYASAADATDGTTKLAKLPSLKIVGPTIRDDALRSSNEARTIPGSGGDYTVLFAARAVELRYTIVGVGRDPTEAAHLWTECKRYFEHTAFLDVPIPSSKLGAETASVELAVDRSHLGEFRGKMTQQAIAQWTLVFFVRGLIPTADRQFYKSHEVAQDVTVDLQPISPGSPAPAAPQDAPEGFGFLDE